MLFQLDTPCLMSFNFKDKSILKGQGLYYHNTNTIITSINYLIHPINKKQCESIDIQSLPDYNQQIIKYKLQLPKNLGLKEYKQYKKCVPILKIIKKGKLKNQYQCLMSMINIQQNLIKQNQEYLQQSQSKLSINMTQQQFLKDLQISMIKFKQQQSNCLKLQDQKFGTMIKIIQNKNMKQIQSIVSLSLKRTYNNPPYEQSIKDLAHQIRKFKSLKIFKLFVNYPLTTQNCYDNLINALNSLSLNTIQISINPKLRQAQLNPNWTSNLNFIKQKTIKYCQWNSNS